ncbi:helix-turn-helix domain-containing protein [Streptomyces sp. NBC_01077]|uniref:MmyB family transcriptional regulator n=1 Tax=Streptomyces sp. NBC_01077 TaxID=2903746 RepID=UPI003866E174|nr:helix-turn-helix domain-containing protein [Streptomyces sp. NBC_01077]
MRLSAHDRHSLKKVLQERRASIDPVTRGFPRRLPGPGRRAVGLSQEQMDELLVRAQGTYNRFENGQLVNPGADLLSSVAKVLRLSEQEWTFLWQLTRKENPPSTLHGSAGTTLAGMWRQVIEGITGTLAYICDAEWNVVTHNEDFRLLFPREQVPANIARWLLLDSEARTQVLTDWTGHWAPAIMPHLRQSVELRPDNAALNRLERDVLDDPVAGPLYRDGAAVPLPFADGSELQLRHAVHGPGRLTTCLAEPILAPGARINLSIFTPDDPDQPAKRPG